jgi:ArsR family transcriptional regulator
MPRKKQSEKRIFEMQCEICRAMAHPLRLEIVERLNKTEMSARDLLDVLVTSKGNLSKHMAQLIQAGIVMIRREGRQAFYKLTHPEIHEACSIVRSILYRRLKKEEDLLTALRSPKNR